MKQRILMNAADASPGGGPATSSNSTPAPAPNPSPTPQAQGDGQPLTLDGVKPVLMQLVRDALNADARRSGSGKQPQPKPKNNGASAPTFDGARYRELDRAVTRAGMAETLSGTAYRRLERAFADENPEDAESWVADYFAGLGVAKSKPTTTATNTTATTAVTAAPTTPPVSDRGAPPAVQAPLEERDLTTLSAADRAALIQSKGLDWYVKTLARQQAGKRIKF